MSILDEIRPAAKLWLEKDGRPVLGQGGAAILEAIREERSLSRAAQRLGMSYRYVWSYLERMGRAAGIPVVKTFKGGRAGGGGAELTQMGKHLLEEYRRFECLIGWALRGGEGWEAAGPKPDERNRLKGRVRSVERIGAFTRVELEIETPAIITGVILTEGKGEIDIKADDKVGALIKANIIMIEKEN